MVPASIALARLRRGHGPASRSPRRPRFPGPKRHPPLGPYASTMPGSGNLAVEARARYAYVRQLLAADFPAPGRVVELGSAPGTQVAELARAGYRATSVDIGSLADAWSGAADGTMRALLAAAGVVDVTWDLEQVPYPLEDRAYDAVVMTEVFEHLRDYPIRSLQEVHRILRPGGRLFFTTPNQAHLLNRLRLLGGRNTQTPLPDWVGGIPHARHAREYLFSEIDELMALADLRVVRRESRHFHVAAGRTSSAARIGKRAVALIARARPTLGPQIIVVAERVA